jgi:hypothetical protein
MKITVIKGNYLCEHGSLTGKNAIGYLSLSAVIIFFSCTEPLVGKMLIAVTV